MIASRYDMMEISYTKLLEEHYGIRVPEFGAFLKDKNAILCGGSILYANKPWEVELDEFDSDLNIIYQTIPTDEDNAFDWKLHMIGIQEYTVLIGSTTPIIPGLKSCITFQKINIAGRWVKITVMELYSTWKEFIETSDMSIHQNYAIFEENNVDSNAQFVIYTYHPNLLKYRLFKKMYESDQDSQNERIAKYSKYGYHYFVEHFSSEVDPSNPMDLWRLPFQEANRVDDSPKSYTFLYIFHSIVMKNVL